MTAMTTVQLGQLTPDEQTRLSDLEAAVARGMETFVEVGTALASIRDQRLYRATHATFEDYAQERWGLARSHTYRLIEAAEVVGALSPIGDTPTLTNEAQARAIAPVLKSEGPEAAAEVLRSAAESGPVTAKGIAEAASNRAKVTETTRTTEATKVERIVDLDTGEIVEPQPPQQRGACQPPPAKRQRAPLPDAFFQAAYDAAKKIATLHNLTTDDRWTRNAEQVARYRHDLLRTRDLLEQVIAALPNPQEG